MWFLLLQALASPPTSVDPLPSWMVGCWTTHEDPQCREVWSESRAGIALGHSVCDGDWGVSWEHLWLGDLDGVRTLVIHPKGQASHAFPLVDEGPDRLVFADPEHDFPQKLTYARGVDGPVVDVSGTPDGAQAPTSLTLRFAPCDRPVAPRGAPPETPDPVGCVEPDSWVSRQLAEAARADAKDRTKEAPAVRAARTEVRRGLAAGAVASGAVCSAADAWHAGLLLQRGGNDRGLAFQLLQQACDARYPSACPHAAGAWDAQLVARGAPPWFGAVYKGDGGAACLVAFDPDSTDASRTAYGAPLLGEVAHGAWKTLTGAVPADASYEALVEAGLTCASKAP